MSVMGRVSVMALMHTGLSQQEALNTLSLESRSDPDVSGWEQAWSPPFIRSTGPAVFSNQDWVFGVFLGQNHPIPPQRTPPPCPRLPLVCNFGVPGLLEVPKNKLNQKHGKLQKRVKQDKIKVT